MPSPIRILFAGNADAAGAASLPVKAPPTLYGVLTLVGQCAGNPNWIVNSAGQLLDAGNGPQVNLGPILTTPGEFLTITIAGAKPGALISGTLSGTQHATAEEAAANYQPRSNPITLNTFQSRQRLYPDGVTPATPLSASFTCGAGATVTPRFTLPPGTVQIRILATAFGLKFAYSLLVVGHQSVEQYFGDPNAPGAPLPVPSPTLPFTIPVENDWDSQVDFSVVGDPVQATSYFVSALFTPEAPGQAGAAQSVAQVTPQPWQAPTADWLIASGGIGAGATLVLVAALGTLPLYLFESNIHLLAGAAGSFGQLQLTDGTPLRQMNFAVADTYTFQFYGRKYTGGVGLQIKNTSAAASGALNGGGNHTQQ